MSLGKLLSTFTSARFPSTRAAGAPDEWHNLLVRVENNRRRAGKVLAVR